MRHTDVLSPPPTMSASEIADLFGWKLATFLRKRGTLHAAGFPRPLPTGSGSPIWSRRLVDLWIATNGAAQPVDPEQSLDPITAAREALETRIGREAA